MSWWQRPVGLRALLWSIGLVGVIWAVGLGAGVWWCYRHWQGAIEVRSHAVQLHLPGGMQATASVSQPVVVPLKVSPKVPLHLDQSVRASLDQPLLAQVDLKQRVPIDTVVPVRLTVPVQTQLHLKVRVKPYLPEVEVDVPVELQLPVDWQVPVKADVPLNARLLVSGQLQHTTQVPIRADWVLRPQVHTQLKVQVQGQTHFILPPQGLQLPVTIERAEVRLPVNLGVQGKP